MPAHPPSARRALAWLVYFSAVAFLSPFWVIYVVASGGLMTATYDTPLPSLAFVVATFCVLLAVSGVVTWIVMRIWKRGST